jgi:hypothetical protein
VGDWYRDHNISPEAAGDEVYREWAQDAGARVDLAGNVIWPGDRGFDPLDDLDDAL